MELHAQAPRTDSVSRAVNDSLLAIQFSEVYISANRTVRPLTIEERRQLWRRIRDVKKVYPYAKYVAATIIETYEYLQTLPDKKSRDEHMKRVEADIKREYTPRMKKLTYAQGKLLIKLIYRETSSSSYQLIQAFLGPIRAGFYQAFAWFFGASLKKEYQPNGVDRLTERVVLQVEAGQL